MRRCNHVTKLSSVQNPQIGLSGGHRPDCSHGTLLTAIAAFSTTRNSCKKCADAQVITAMLLHDLPLHLQCMNARRSRGRESPQLCHSTWIYPVHHPSPGLGHLEPFLVMNLNNPYSSIPGIHIYQAVCWYRACLWQIMSSLLGLQCNKALAAPNPPKLGPVCVRLHSTIKCRTHNETSPCTDANESICSIWYRLLHSDYWIIEVKMQSTG